MTLYYKLYERYFPDKYLNKLLFTIEELHDKKYQLARIEDKINSKHIKRILKSTDQYDKYLFNAAAALKIYKDQIKELEIRLSKMI